MDVELPILIQRQPDYTTCGPTSLHVVYYDANFLVIRPRRAQRKKP